MRRTDCNPSLSDNLKAVNDSEMVRNKVKTIYYKQYERETTAVDKRTVI